MKCSCGYIYSDLDNWQRDIDDAYLLVKNRDFNEFFQKELALRNEPNLNENSKKYFELIAKAAVYCGSLRKCPICHRYLLILPDENEMFVLVQEFHGEAPRKSAGCKE
jgi:hypothetical protein